MHVTQLQRPPRPWVERLLAQSLFLVPYAGCNPAQQGTPEKKTGLLASPADPSSILSINSIHRDSPFIESEFLFIELSHLSISASSGLHLSCYFFLQHIRWPGACNSWQPFLKPPPSCTHPLLCAVTPFSCCWSLAAWLDPYLPLLAVSPPLGLPSLPSVVPH